MIFPTITEYSIVYVWSNIEQKELATISLKTLMQKWSPESSGPESEASEEKNKTLWPKMCPRPDPNTPSNESVPAISESSQATQKNL